MAHATTNRPVIATAGGAACVLACCMVVGTARAAIVVDPWSSAVRGDRGDAWSVEVDEQGALLDRNWGATAWWNDSLGGVIRASALEGPFDSPAQRLVADAGAAWRLASEARGSADFVVGTRVAASRDGSVAARPPLGLGDYRGDAVPLVGLRGRMQIERGIALTTRGEVAVPDAGEAAGWSVGGGLGVELGAGWRLSLDAEWRSLGSSLERALGGSSDGGSGEGAIRIGFSREF